MNKKHSFIFYLIVLVIFLPFMVLAQDWKVNSNYWTATDALGRKTPNQSEVGVKKSDKYIAMFYWTWHTDNLADFSPVMNITEILSQFPDAANDANHAAWQGIWGGVFWWDEPLFGYYRTTDEWVLRKHAEMLADAGVDVVFFDCTNGSFTWKTSYVKLLEVWDQARIDGVKTPQIAFLLPFGETDGALVSIKEIYNDLYQPGLYHDLWFMWKGKPIIMAYPEILKPKNGDTAGMKFTASSPFSAIDVTCPSWSNNIGNLTLKLFKWNIFYSTTVSATPLAEKTFVNFSDNERLLLTFDIQQPGEYLWQLSDGTETVGVWKYTDSTDPVISFFNGQVVSGNYESRIYDAVDSLFNPLATGTTHVPVQITPGTDVAFVDSIRNFFTFRPGQPDYVNGPSRNDHWGWLENYPQHGYVGSPSAGYEQVTVGVAQNARDASGGHCYAFNAPGTYGRSYTQSNGQDSRPDAYLYGLNFAEQWDRAFELDPELVFITGWNEWIAGRHENWPPSDPHKPFAFPDQYNWDKSRDIEPVKAWGNKGDVYYIQLVNNIRKFKGIDRQDTASAEKTINISALDSWTDVKPEYWHYKGNTLHRNHKGQGDQLIYKNTTGRNDIVLAKVARDNHNIYFYIETAENLSPKTDPNWMCLFIDIDRDKTTGWEGYDFLINRSSPGDSAEVEISQKEWNWTKVGSAAYVVNDKILVLKVKRSTLDLPNDGELDFEFKWSDNRQQDGNIMDFYINGDAAPGGRFNFVYTTGNTTGVSKNNDIPGNYSLSQNYPNPFNNATKIKYELSDDGPVELSVYDITGRKIEVLVDTIQIAGTHDLLWSAGNLSSGVYLLFLKTRAGSLYKKILLIK